MYTLVPLTKGACKIVHTWATLNEHLQLYMHTNEYITQDFRVSADNEVYLHN